MYDEDGEPVLEVVIKEVLEYAIQQIIDENSLRDDLHFTFEDIRSLDTKQLVALHTEADEMASLLSDGTTVDRKSYLDKYFKTMTAMTA